MVKSFSSIRKNELSSVLSSIDYVGGSSEVNMTEKIVRFTSSVTCRLVFGKLCRDHDELINLMKDALFLVGGFDVGDFFPSWKLLYKMSGAKSKLVKMHQNIDSVLERIVNEHIKNRAAGIKGNGAYGGEDLVDVFLRIKENDQLQFPITNDHIKAVILDMFTAGTESSSTTIIWALSELMKHPKIMAKAQSKVRQAFKEKIDFDEEDLDNVPYLKKTDCPGMQFGLANVKQPLARLLYHFDWGLPCGTSTPKDLDMSEKSGLSAAKEKDLYLIAKTNQSLDMML
uniref:Cytochrome P450 n=1 Tax=Solanum tuberosum TaxID=4113 RepID=M1BTU4_SOLTU